MRKLLCVAAVWLLTVACEQEHKVVPEKSIVEELTHEAISSEEFQSLAISESSLEISNAQFINVSKNSIFIPFKDIDDKKGIVVLFNNDYKIKTVALYDVLTQTPTGQIYDQLKNGTFSGQFIFTSQGFEVDLHLEESKVISSKSIYKSHFGRTTGCNSIDEDGGAADCAGERLANMNWVDATFCYASFVPCMAQLTISCWVDGC